jgi:uracil-DNA glycosylase
MQKPVDSFIGSLKKSPKRNGVFNPWWDTDSDNDIDNRGPVVRRRQLRQYLIERIGKAKILLVGEAIGYQGGHFTGIPMTSERILLGGHIKRGIFPEDVFTGIKPKRTSNPNLKLKGFSEPTGTIVWGHLINSGINPRDVILWNAFPWHPYNPDLNFFSNRTPSREEFKEGSEILTSLIKISCANNIIAVGEKAYELLCSLGIEAKKVRHPANGGAKKFREQFSRMEIGHAAKKSKFIR